MMMMQPLLLAAVADDMCMYKHFVFYDRLDVVNKKRSDIFLFYYKATAITRSQIGYAMQIDAGR